MIRKSDLAGPGGFSSRWANKTSCTPLHISRREHLAIIRTVWKALTVDPCYRLRTSLEVVANTRGSRERKGVGGSGILKLGALQGALCANSRRLWPVFRFAGVHPNPKRQVIHTCRSGVLVRQPTDTSLPLPEESSYL